MPGSSFNAPASGSLLADRYQLTRLIARGGMGDVYEAQDEQLGRSVAVKVFRAGASSDRGRFDAEIRTLAALSHPGLVQVYDAGEQDGDAFVVLELVDGPTLTERLVQGALQPEEVAEVGIAVADALAYVHEHGVVHRDVTPSNILCGPDGRPRLADFGIARLIDTTRVTQAATALGTAAYMAPEQVQGHDVTPAADVYALGLVLLELLTGRRGFTGSPHEVIVARLARRPDTDTGVPDGWRPVLAEMTDRAAPNRPSATTVRDRLVALVATSAASAGARPVAPVASPSVLVPAPDGSSQPVDEATRSAAAVGGTSVMPIALMPDEPAAPVAAPVSVAALTPRRRRILVGTIVGLVLLVTAMASADGGDFGLTPGADPSTSTTTAPEPVVAVEPSTTVPPPTTEAPAPAANGGGKGNGKGNDKGDDEGD